MSRDALAEADDAAQALLLLYERLGVQAVLLTLRDEPVTLLVLCQNAEDVVPLCERVVEEHQIPAERSIN